MSAIYGLIVFAAAILGALCGLGGGVIINPALGAISDYSAVTISVLSGLCVLTISVVSVVKRLIEGVQLRYRNSLLLAFGSIVGGFLGNFLLDLMAARIEDAHVKIFQYSFLAVLLIFVLVYMSVLRPKNKFLTVKNFAVIILAGLILGTISAFLGIGGGPINVAVLCLLFGMDVKEASVNSLFMIIFSQSAKFVTRLIAGTMATALTGVSFWLVAVLLAAAVVGALVGSYFNKKFGGKTILVIYNLAVGSIILLNIYNVIVNVFI